MAGRAGLAFLFIVPHAEAARPEITRPLGTGPYRFVVFGYDPNVSEVPYDLPQARILLADAGFGNGFSVDLAHGSIPPAYVAELVDDLGRLGIRVQATQYSLSELLQQAQRRVLDALPILPLTARSEFVGVSARVDVPVRYDGWLWVAGFRWRR